MLFARRYSGFGIAVMGETNLTNELPTLGQPEQSQVLLSEPQR